MEDLGLDLAEHALSENNRILKRLGVTHLWRVDPGDDGIATPPPSAKIETRAETVHDSPPVAPPAPALPPVLRALFHGKQAPITTLWTYAELYADLQALNAPVRLELFRKIQDAARAQGGWTDSEICVWPATGRERILETGLEIFQPRLILVFGAATGLGGPAALDTLASRSITVKVLPSLDAMIAGDHAAKSNAWDFLKSAPATFRLPRR